jgi:hypothetical protein
MADTWKPPLFRNRTLTDSAPLFPARDEGDSNVTGDTSSTISVPTRKSSMVHPACEADRDDDAYTNLTCKYPPDPKFPVSPGVEKVSRFNVTRWKPV